MNKTLTALIYTLAALLPSTGVRAETAYQSHDAVYEEVKTYLAARLDAQADYEISVQAIDTRLRLAACPVGLELFPAGGQNITGRLAVGVRCTGQTPWTIYVSALVKAYRPVVVLNRPLQRGEIIQPGYLSIEKKDVTSLHGDFISEPGQAAYKQAARPILAGSAVSLQQLKEPVLVKRGDKVTISAGQATFSVKMNGQAMRDGAKDELIPVKNQSSGRLVSARVLEPGLVSIIN